MQMVKNKYCALFASYLCLLVMCFQQEALASHDFNNIKCLDTASIKNNIDLTPNILYRKAPNNDVPLEHYDDSILTGSWARNTKSAPNLGLDAGKYWFALCLQNDSNMSWDGLIEISMHMLDYVDYYKVSQSSFVKLGEAGNRRPFSSRTVTHRHHVFPTFVEGNAQITLLFTVSNLGTLLFPAKIWEKEHFHEKDLAALAVQFLLGGIGLALTLYNLFLLISTRDSTYFWYVLVVSSTNLYSLTKNGVMAQFVWPEWPNFDNLMVLEMAGVLLLSASMFAYRVLNICSFPQSAKILYKCCIAAGILCIVGSPVVELSTMTKMGVIFALTAPLLFILSGFYSYINGNKIALIFTLAWLVFAGAGILTALNHIAILPDIGIFKHSLQIGGAIEGLLLSFVLAYRINNEKQARIEAQDSVLRIKESANKELERRVEDRTKELKQAQGNLVQKEKLAALGSLVAGISHELNTPVGNAVTVASSIQRDTKHISRAMENGISRSRLSQYIENMEEGSNLLLKNLEKTSDLVLSFKQVAVDRTSAQRRSFDLTIFLNETQVTITSQMKWSPYRFEIQEHENVTLDSYPGPLGQVITNLVNNAVSHGFDDEDQGTIILRAQVFGSELRLEVEDNGRGIEKNNLPHIFDPFFTTKLGKGGSGLGLHIVHNIVHAVLGGSIDVNSNVSEGTKFIVYIPLIAPKETPPKKKSGISQSRKEALEIEEETS